MGEKGKKELLKIFEQLNPVNQADLLAHIRVALVAQENTKKEMNRSAKTGRKRKTA